MPFENAGVAEAAGHAATPADEDYGALYDVEREARDIGNYIEEDPVPGMNALREKAPVQKGYLRKLLNLPQYHRHPIAYRAPGYTCFTFEACEQAFRDNVNLSSAVYALNDSGQELLSILEMDNPQHFAYRKAVQSLFIRPRAQSWWRDAFIAPLVGGLIENLHGQDRAELNLQLCARVPVHTITQGVGLRGSDSLTFRRALVHTFAGDHGDDVKMQAYATVHRMLMEQITTRRTAPGEDIISWLLAAEIDPPGEASRHLTDDEVVNFAKLLLIAGGGTTWRQLGIVLLALLSEPELLEEVRNNRRLIEPAIEESLRWNPTNPLFSRVTLNDVEIAGVTIPAGNVVDICLGAANRDPRRWDNPDAFDMHRPFKQHLGTGIGPHMCLGRFVAQVEMEATINRLLDEFPRLRLDPDQPRPTITGGLEQRGVSALPVLLT